MHHNQLRRPIFIASVLLVAAQIAPADSRAAMPAALVADRAKPATVLIVTRSRVRGSCPTVDLDSDRLKARVTELISSGDIKQDMSEQEVMIAVFNAILAEPGAYFKPGTTSRPIDKELTYTGSGVIVTPDGYLVTNAHVVSPSKEDTGRALIENLEDWVKSDMKDIETEVSNLFPGKELRDEAKERLAKALAAFYAENLSIGKNEDRVYAVPGYARPGESLESIGKLCDIKKLGKAIPGKDVALLKIPGANYATLPLAADVESGEIRTGDELHVVGYPGIATFSPALSLASPLEPSMTNGRVSALKAMADGWKVIQTDAPLAPGNSGGPVLNERAEVVGLATFASVDPTTGQQVQGFNFVVPADIVREFLRDGNVTVRESSFTNKYNKALDDYQRRYYSSALKTFREAGEESPDVPYVKEYISHCQSEISAGHDESWKKFIWIVALGAILGIIAVVAALTRRFRVVPAGPAGSQGATA